MAKSTGLEKVKIFSPSLMAKIASYHIGEFVKRVGTKGLDYRGKMMRPYTKRYRDLKASGFEGKRPKSLEGQSLDRQVFPPNMKLTGRTLGALERKKWDDDSWTIGWSGEAAKIVSGNADRNRKRDIKSDIPDSEKKKIVDEISEGLDKELRKKLKNVTITVEM